MNYSDNQNFNTSQNSWTCFDCGGSETQFRLKIIPSGKADSYYPKWITQIKESCSECGKYRRFAPQTDILIERFNQRFEAITLRAKGNDK